MAATGNGEAVYPLCIWSFPVSGALLKYANRIMGKEGTQRRAGNAGPTIANERTLVNDIAI